MVGNNQSRGTDTGILIREVPSTESMISAWSDNHHIEGRATGLWDHEGSPSWLHFPSGEQT